MLLLGLRTEALVFFEEGDDEVVLALIKRLKNLVLLSVLYLMSVTEVDINCQFIKLLLSPPESPDQPVNPPLDPIAPLSVTTMTTVCDTCFLSLLGYCSFQ